MKVEPAYLIPGWPAPSGIRALSTLRSGGVSAGSYRGLNLADHVGDSPAAVAENRTILHREMDLPSEPFWLNQVHGTAVRRCGSSVAEADASMATAKGQVCAILTADCLPVLFCNRAGTRVAAAHAGWRGLAAGILESTLCAFGDVPGDILAWLGPAIGPESFEVGPEVREIFTKQDIHANACFAAGEGDRLFADIYALARRRLLQQGVDAIYGGEWDTFSNPEQFFSYRRDGLTGRMGTLIWME